jgi:tetratricopeptide (TPR) repeat protein
LSETGNTTTRRVTLIVLGLLLAGTVFLLPHFVTEPWVADETDALPPVPATTSSAVAPSTAAELKQYRQESQGVLAEIVVMRDRLLERQVTHWAEADFKQALALVESGDERYSYGDYATSLAQYREARDRLAGLEQLAMDQLAKAKTDAQAAVESLNLVVAQDAARLAGLIAPGDPEVQALAQRVEVLPEVAGHIEAGDQALALARYAEAQSAYRAATGLDPAHQRATESLARANREVSSSVFRGHMSRGFAALERQDYVAARGAFHEAGRVSPGDPAVGKALAQVANLESGKVVGTDLGRAAELESREQWSEAVSVYESLLQQDPSLTDARVKLVPARVRAELDNRLSGYIDEPLRLSTRSEFEAAQTALADARGIPEAGPRLRGQIEQLDLLVQRANSPIDVVFRSDNQTHVVLFRVADLGRFEQHSMKLRPGKYVAAGTRSGYRDVRVEFTVTGETLAEPIVVRCEEPIG